MPPLPPPEIKKQILLPPRHGTVAADVDVLVVGGGPSGLGAALGAAAAGARVAIAERYGFFGGNATAALVMPLMAFNVRNPGAAAPAVDLMPNDNGAGDPVVAGVVRKFINRLVRSGGAVAPSGKTGFTVPFDPEMFKMTALTMLDEAGVSFLFHAFASGVTGGSTVDGVIFETKSGPVVIRARCVVDGTGDGDVAALAGASYEIGRAGDGLVQPMTLMFRMVDFDHPAFAAYVKEHPGQWRGVHGLWDLIHKAIEAGELDLPREDILFFGTPRPHEVAVNSTRVNRVLGTNVFDWTHAEWLARRQMDQISRFLRKYVPGFERAYVAQSGVHVGVRETRRIVGEYCLTASDVLEARKFDDVIARCTYPIDIHNPEGRGTVLKRVPDGDAYDIPLRCLLPQKVDNVIVAGRCISGTHEAHSSYRVMPVSMATGQAAGVCAALSARLGRPPRDVPPDTVQEELLRQGANLRGLRPRSPAARA